MRGKSFIRLIGLLVPLLFIFVFSNTIANADDDGQSNDINQQLQSSDNSNQTLADLNQYQPSNNDNLGNWTDSYGSQTRSDASTDGNAGITNTNDFDYALSYKDAKYNDLSEEQDWQKKIDPLGSYYASAINKYVQKGYHIQISTDDLDNAQANFENYIKNKNLSPDYTNFENLKDSRYFWNADDFNLSLSNLVNSPYIQSADGKMNVTGKIDFLSGIAAIVADDSQSDNLQFQSVDIQNSFGSDDYVYQTKDGHKLNINNQSIQDYSGTYQAPIYVVNFKDLDHPTAYGTYTDENGTTQDAAMAIPLDYLLFVPLKVYDSDGNLVTNGTTGYPRKIDFISNSKIISTQDITAPNNTSFVLKESDLQIPSGYKLGTGMNLTFDSRNPSSDYTVQVQSLNDTNADDSNQNSGDDDNDGGFQDVISATQNFLSNPVQATVDLVKRTSNQFVSYAKDLYKKSKDTISYGIQSLINTFFNSTGNFNVKLLSKGAFKALSGAASMIDKISDFKSKMIQGIIHGGISAAIKQSFKDFQSAIVSKIKTLTSFNLHSLVDKINAVKNTPKKFIGNVKAMSRHFSNSVNSAKEVMKNEMDYVNSVIGSVRDNPYIVGKLNAIKSGLGSQMAYFNKYQSQATIKTYSEAKKAYSRYQKVNEIINNVSNTVNGIKAALNPQTSQVAKWLKQYSDNGMAFGFTRKKNLLTMVTPWGDFKFNYHYEKIQQTLYNKFIITKEVIQTIVHTGFEAAGNLLESAADDMISAFPEGLIGTVLIYGLVEGFRDFGLQDKVEKGITDSVYGSIGNQEYTDKQIADHLNPLALINF